MRLDRGCGRLEWAVLDWNEPAIQFYRSLGASPMDDWTVFRLADGPLSSLAERDGRGSAGGGPVSESLESYFRPHIRAMSGYVPGEQPRGFEFVKLNTNENPYPPSPRVAEAISLALLDGRLRRYPDPLAISFRESAARTHGVDPSMILAGNGSDDLLTIITRAFAGPGDAVVYPTPSYVLYRTLAELEGARRGGSPV